MRDARTIEERLHATASVAREGYTQEVAFLESGLYAVTFLPTSTVRAHLVVCPAFLEHATLQPTELGLLSASAPFGVAGIYVQPPGVGESSGTLTATTLAQRLDAASSALGHLRHRTDTSSLPTWFFGARSGAILAARAAQSHGGAGAIFWDPAFEAEEYFRQVRRLLRVSSVAGGALRLKDPFQALREGSRATILGNPVSAEQLSEFEEVSARWNDIHLDGPVLAVAMTEVVSAGIRARLQGIADDATVISLDKRDATGLGMSVRDAPEAIAPTLSWFRTKLG
jgi:hypothetical protein